MHQTIFVRNKDRTPALKAAAGEIFRLLGLKNSEERESSNYIEGYYFLGHAVNAAIKVCLSDGSVKPEYPIWITIETPKSWARDVTERISTDPSVIASQLTIGGWEVFIPFGSWGTKEWNEDGKLYTP